MTEGIRLLVRFVVWQKARKAPGRDEFLWRLDDYGLLIHWDEYGNRNSMYGWELDHYPVPKSRGGFDDIGNLRALSWIANAIHGGHLGAASKAESDRQPQRGMFGALLRPQVAEPVSGFGALVQRHQSADGHLRGLLDPEPGPVAGLLMSGFLGEPR